MLWWKIVEGTLFVIIGIVGDSVEAELDGSKVIAMMVVKLVFHLTGILLTKCYKHWIDKQDVSYITASSNDIKTYSN